MADQILRICLIKEIRRDFLLNSPLSILHFQLNKKYNTKTTIYIYAIRLQMRYNII